MGKLVKATWEGPFNGTVTLPDGTSTTLVSGETVVEIGEDEAKTSAYWQPVRAASKKDES